MMRYLLALLLIAAPAFAEDPPYADGPEARIYSEMPAEWRSCSATSECSVIHYGCSGGVAVSQGHVKDAQDLVWKIGGDPKSMNCFKAGPEYTAACTSSQCVALPDLDNNNAH